MQHVLELTYQLNEISIQDSPWLNNTATKEFLNLRKARNFITSNFFTNKTFNNTKEKRAPKQILKTLIFNLGREGTKSRREANSILNALSLIGGFVTTMYYITFYSYKFLTTPVTELKLAYAFEKIVQRFSHCNTLKKSLKLGHVDDEVEVLRSCRFRIEYFIFKRCCCFKSCRKFIIKQEGFSLVEHLKFVENIKDNFDYCTSINYMAHYYKENMESKTTNIR